MIKKWVLFISLRYIKNERRNRKISPGVLSVLALAVGVMALITVISVMNGFQLGFIEDIIEISSYHLRISKVDKDSYKDILNVKGIKSVMPFTETQTLINSPYTMTPCLVKGVAKDAESLDSQFFEQLNIYKGDFIPNVEKTVVIGRILAMKLGLGLGDYVSLIALNGGSFRSLKPATSDFLITGVFNSGYNDFDSNMIIMTNDSIRYIDEGVETLMGIKLKERFNDQRVIKELAKKKINEENIISWRVYNRSFFSALRLEKTVMIILLGLIFLVVSFGIYNSTKRTIVEKQEEIGIIRAIGATPAQIKAIFIIDGAIIGFSGGGIGTILGLLITSNLNEILRTFTFSHSSFLINMPVRIVPKEIILIFCFAILFCVFSALFAANKTTKITPQEVLRYE